MVTKNILENFMNYFQTTNSNTSEINLTSISSTLSYRIIGFTSISDRLRVNLRISNNTDLRHTDTLDLYLAKARNQLIRDTAKKLSVEVSDVEKDIDELINFLEESEPFSNDENIMTESERSEAIKTLKSKQLFKRILNDFETCGYVGEEEAKLFGYIATVSRLLAKPLGILIVSRSGAGKSTLQEAITNFIPHEDLLSFTRITAQSLFYTEKDALRHKVLSIAEEDGMQDAIYSIRTLQSDQRLSISVTNNENGQMKTDENEVEGPVVIMITTTNPEALDYETRNRFVILTIDESREQTERILKIQRAADSLDGLINESNKPEIIKRHQNMQRLLKPIAVHNPYYDQLSFSADKLQMRREQKKYLTLIKSIALLRQYQKDIQSKSGVEYISVDKTDIKLANQLAIAVLGRNLDELAPHSRTLVNDIVDLWQKSKLALNDYKFTMHELLANLNWSRWQLMQNMKQLIELEYVFVLSGGSQGRKTVYGLNYDGEADESGRFLNYILPIEKLKEPSL
jgi:energy-coupling factor transporter ATP-binding protein EcfA2